MHLLRSPAAAAIAVVVTVLAAGCGDDGGSADPDVTTTTEAAADPTTTATEATTTTGDATDTDPSSTTTTTAAATTTVAPGEALTSGSVTNAAGVRVDWELTGDAATLCFDLEVDDADRALSLAPDAASCITPDGGLDAMDDPMSVSIGRVDGEGAFGYLWGRVEPGILTVNLEFVDGTQQTVELVDGPTEVRVFAVVVDTAAVPGVDSIDALSGTRVEHSVRVGAFVRSGPAYPTVTPTPTAVPVEYPEAGG